MRNRFAGNCYKCHKFTPPNFGHFERKGKGWLVRCACCVSPAKVNKPLVRELQSLRLKNILGELY